MTEKQQVKLDIIMEWIKRPMEFAKLFFKRGVMVYNNNRYVKKQFWEGAEMLNIFYGDMPEAIFNPSVYFKNVYDESWIVEPFTKEMIKDVDRSTVIGPRIIDSPVLGGITPRELSGGVKTLILIEHLPDKVFNASACGDNCAKWLLKIGEKHDVTINLRHIMDFGDDDFCVRVQNTNQLVHNMEKLLLVAGKLVR